MTETKKTEKKPHRGTENLISLADRPLEERRRIAAMGGRAGAKARSVSLKLNFLAKKGMTDETAKKMYEIMTDADLSSLDILLQLQRIKSKITDEKAKMAMSRLLMDWHKLQHGEKIKGEITHISADDISDSVVKKVFGDVIDVETKEIDTIKKVQDTKSEVEESKDDSPPVDEDIFLD